MKKVSPTPELDARIKADPDLVDRIFEYLLKEFPQIAVLQLETTKRAVREEFAGQEAYVQARPRERVAAQVLALFNGRNASEVARRLGIGRATVYRCIKQAGEKSVSDFPVNETAARVRSAPSAPSDALERK